MNTTYNENPRARGPILLQLFPFVILNGFCIDSFLTTGVSERVIDGISSNLANTFLPSRQILIRKTLELGANIYWSYFPL